VSISAGRLLAVLFIHLSQFTKNEKCRNSKKMEIHLCEYVLALANRVLVVLFYSPEMMDKHNA